MRSESYTEKEIEQLLKNYIIQQFMYEKSDVILENDLLLLEEGIIDSLSILRLIDFIEKQFDINIGSEALVSENFRTVDAIKSLVISKLQVSVHQEIVQKYKEEKTRSIIPVKPHGCKRPFFYVHGLGGYGSESILAHYLHPERPFYGLQAIGLDEKQAPHTHIEDMMAYYIQEIQTIQPEGPYLLGGRCIGGSIAFEMAQELKKRGQQVLLVAMSDSPNPFVEEKQRVDGLNHWRLFDKPNWREKLINKGLGLSKVENILRVMDANQQIIVNHKPHLYSGQVVYFSAQENCEEIFNPMQPNGWNSWVAGGIEIIEVPGKHGIYHNEPHVRVLAEKLNACLEQADREYEPKQAILVQINTMSDRNNQLIAHYQKALIIKYDSSHVHEKLAKIYQSQFKFKEAYYHYIKSLKFDPNNFKNYWNLKFFLLSLITWSHEKIHSDLLEEGITIVRQTIQHKSNFPFARVVLGILLTLQGKSKDAIDSYQAASYQQILLSHPQLIKKNWNFAQKLQPSFIIPGFIRCGTSSLYSYLNTHPQILPAVDKELHFFGNFSEQGLDYYLAHFPSISNSTNYITGEATPTYLNSPKIAKQIFTLFPKMKFIILLRNPVDRAISSYYHRHQASGEYQLTPNSITETIEKIPSLMNQWFDWLFYEPPLFLENYQHYINYVLLPDLLGSLYIYHIKEWMTVFPREQFLILKSEDLFANPSATMKQVYEFLDIPEYQPPAYRNINPNFYSAIPDRLRYQLVEFFRSYNQQLEEYLGMKFNWE